MIEKTTPLRSDLLGASEQQTNVWRDSVYGTRMNSRTRWDFRSVSDGRASSRCVGSCVSAGKLTRALESAAVRTPHTMIANTNLYVNTRYVFTSVCVCICVCVCLHVQANCVGLCCAVRCAVFRRRCSHRGTQQLAAAVLETFCTFV